MVKLFSSDSLTKVQASCNKWLKEVGTLLIGPARTELQICKCYNSETKKVETEYVVIASYLSKEDLDEGNPNLVFGYSTQENPYGNDPNNPILPNPV